MIPKEVIVLVALRTDHKTKELITVALQEHPDPSSVFVALKKHPNPSSALVALSVSIMFARNRYFLLVVAP